MKRVTLELGGKSPTVLLDDAALDKAIPSALIMAFMNSGQACAAGTRLLVPKSRLDEVKNAIREAMHAFTVGDPADPKTGVVPMVSQKQYAASNRISARALTKVPRCWSAARAIRRASKRVIS
jgi:aldehyde dehydrogenase (NAD+)